MRRFLASAAVAGAALLALPAAAHAAETDPRTVPLPFLWPRADLTAVAPDGAGGVWIGGGQGAHCLVVLNPWCYNIGNPVVRRWTGSGWREYPIRGWTGNGFVRQVASGAGGTWIGGVEQGAAGTNRLFAFDGTSFRRVETPSAAIGVLSTGPAGTWITQDVPAGSGEPHLLRRDGDAWTAVGLPDPGARFNDVRASSAADVWAAGSRPGADGGERRPAVARFDGTAWTRLPEPDLPSSTAVDRVVPLAPDDVWVSANAHLAHWDGSAWTTIDGPGGPVVDIAVDGSGAVWAATVPSGGTGLARYEDGAWRQVAVPDGAELHDLAAVGASTIWGVGRANDAPIAVRTG
ncbi:hypothetical protein [Actinomadura sp. WAC 06369]|uniref:hypothetical protein n=1 Tax=Actinomadura sp. WAC 06369 TaxID=2203193 RepID=UPI000F7B5349|nr:hypothetical protein [Actinomadura sp. WAC 06369]RSN64078.1 hypothetical protein DMH08_18475 [Actinomadura sp. WAC 06369]